MRKLLALLLALMLPCCALAETISMNWTTDVSADGLSMLIDLLEDPADEGPSFTAKQIAALAELMSGFSLRMDTHESGNRVKMVLSYQDEALVDLDAQIAGDTTLFTLSLLEGMLLTAPMDPALMEAQAAADEAWQHQPWLDLQKRYALFADVWESSLDVTIEYGSFIGDAYSGGKRSTTYRFDERDVAVLLESIITVDQPDNMATLLSFYGQQYFEDPDGLTDYLAKFARDVALRNQYRYVLRVVDDGAEEPTLVGISLLVYEKDQLVATLSMGGDEDRTNIVLGYGIRGENCYLALTQTDDPANEPNLLAKLWRDPGKVGYYAASADEQANLLLTAKVYLDERDNLQSLRAELIGPITQNIPIETTLSLENRETFGDITFSLSLSGERLLTSSMAFTSVEDLPDMTADDLQVIDITDISDEEEQDVASALDKAVTELGLKLFRLLPPELLTLFLLSPLF